MRLDDGWRTLITFANYPNIKLYQKEVTPPGISGRGANDTSTMLNDTVITKAPKNLFEMTDAVGVAAYDPAVITDLVSAIQENQLCNCAFPDGSSWDFWGWLDEFKPNAHKEGEQPTANFTIVCGNQDDNGDEVAPVYNAPA